jgi:hypothetical protein
MWHCQRLLCVIALTLTVGLAEAVPRGKAGANTNDSTICRAFGRLLKVPGNEGMKKKIIVGEESGGYDVYKDIDLDHDGRSDRVAKSCSASVIPADPCILEIELTSGKKYDFVAWRMYLVELNKNTYVVSSELEVSSKSQPRSVHLLGSSGARRICSGL